MFRDVLLLVPTLLIGVMLVLTVESATLTAPERHHGQWQKSPGHLNQAGAHASGSAPIGAIVL